jgi:ABC-type Fe3+/spermidine/putrescine transport system ATPase subunit
MDTPPLATLQIENIQLSLGGRAVLRGLDLSVPAGHTLALIGPSGCGKTSLLRVIAGLQMPDSGRVLLGQEDLTALEPRLRGIGFLFQHYALFPNLTVRENVGFGLEAKAWPKHHQAERIEELLRVIDLSDLAARYPHQLSGGQRQRVAMARALAPKPSVLLMDEPFSAIDESFRVPLRRAFRALQRDLGQTCIIVTHDREEAFELGDTVAIMLDGRHAWRGRPEDLGRAPIHRDAARFLGVYNLFERAPSGVETDVASGVKSHAALQASLRVTPIADRMSPALEGWRFQAKVRSRHPGLNQTMIQLETGDGQVLEALERDDMLKVGTTVQCLQPITDLQPLL